jgi:hypothetical protein
MPEKMPGLTDRTRLHKKANEALDHNLAPGEVIEVIITGPSNQAIIGTNRRAFVYKKGFMAGASFGSELTSWDYRNVTGVQLHTGMMSGAVVLQGPGQSGTNTSYWKNGDSDPYKAPNAIPIVRPWNQASAGVALLRQLIDAVHHPDAHEVSVSPATAQPTVATRGSTPTSAEPAAIERAPVAAPAAEDPMELLRKLGALRDAGVLTVEEFETKKAEILKRI